MRGRKPKPTHLKILEGNPGKRPLPDPREEPHPQATIPECPTWLDPAAQAHWAALAPELARLGLLTIVDGQVLAVYCQAWAEFELATRTLQTEGRVVHTGGQLQPHPAVAQQRSAWKAVKDFAALFGLDPSSRGRLQVAPPEEAAGGLKAFARKRSG